MANDADVFLTSDSQFQGCIEKKDRYILIFYLQYFIEF